MRAIRASQDLRPLTDLKLGAGEIVSQVQRTGRPVVLTRHGRGVAVLLSLESFEEMADQLAETELREALDEGEADIRAGRVHTHATVVAKYTNRPNGQG